jgi:hypothetical protein
MLSCVLQGQPQPVGHIFDCWNHCMMCLMWPPWPQCTQWLAQPSTCNLHTAHFNVGLKHLTHKGERHEGMSLFSHDGFEHAVVKSMPKWLSSEDIFAWSRLDKHLRVSALSFNNLQRHKISAYISLYESYSSSISGVNIRESYSWCSSSSFSLTIIDWLPREWHELRRSISFSAKSDQELDRVLRSASKAET